MAGERIAKVLNQRLSEYRAIEQLRALAKRWPSSFWLYCANGQLFVMRKGPDGGHAMTPGGGVDPAFIEEQNNIEADGGDW